MHFLSRRGSQPFIPVDCAGIPDHLFENELFGHSRGAYTDAYREQHGLAALADKGTLFLDEIDSLSLVA
jgi:two-component system, NtrC family, response regulator GlrR